MDVTKESLEFFLKNLGVTNNLIYVLIIVLILNIGAIVLRFVLEKRLKNKDKEIFRQNLINERSLKAQEQIYTRMHELSLFGKGEDHEFLLAIQELQQFVSRNRLYLNNNLFECVDEVLNYFRVVLTDYRLKDLKNEENLFKKYSKIFNE